MKQVRKHFGLCTLDLPQHKYDQIPSTVATASGPPPKFESFGSVGLLCTFSVMSSSLSSVVSNLVRASMGSAVSNTVTDEDLDRHVADLILKEAKKKAERYGQDGIRAYLPNGGM